MKWMPLLFMCVTLGGCSSDPTCTTDSDCFSGEICTSGSCSQGVRVDTPGNHDAGMSDVTAVDDANTNNTSEPDADVDTSSDVTPDTEPVTYGACEVDRLNSTCTDDEYEPNNQWIDGERLSGMQSGCPTTTTFVPLDLSVDATMCVRDDEDWYYIDFFPCENNDVDIVWTLTFPQTCSAQLFDFDSLSFDCGTEATCTKTDGGATITISVPKTGLRQSQLSYVALKKLSQNFQTDYSLRVQVIQR